MPDFRVSDTAAEHPKFRAAGLAAFGLWTAAGSWSMNPARLTDGWIPAYYVKSWPNGERSARRLVKVGLWTEDNRDGLAGYQYHDWAEYQRLRAGFEEDKRKARERMKSRRSTRGSGDVRANGDGTQPEGTNPVHPPPSPSPSPSTYVGGEGSPPARAGEPPNPHCPKHINDPNPGPCGACADARRARADWDAARDAARLELTAALDRARADPRLRCEHGTDAGLYVRPDTGTSPCALCRAETRAPA